MTPERLKQLEKLERVFHNAISVCDPLDYMIRQRNLSYEIVGFLLKELEDYRNEEAMKSKNFKLCSEEESSTSSD